MPELPDPIERIDANHVRWRGRKLVWFGGCDYFRLARHPKVLRAAASCLREHGLNVAASRKTTGNHPLYEKLELALARFFRAESAIIVSCGSVTNLIVAQALAGEFTHVLLDDRAHPALGDAASHFGARVIRFAHFDANTLRTKVRKLGRTSRVIVLTDGLFAADGTVAPLSAFLRTLPKPARILVDDAHGAGVVGRTVRGSLEHEGVGRERIIQTITLSKAFGAFGGAILGPRSLRSRIIERSRLFIGSTPPPLPSIAAALESLRLVQGGSAMRTRLRQNPQIVRDAMRRRGVSVTDSPAPIVALTPDSAAHRDRLQKALLARGILPPFLRYPGGPEAGSFRFVISSEHQPVHLTALVEAIAAAAVSDGKIG